MNPLTKMLVYILCIDLVLFIAQLSMIGIAGTESTNFYNNSHLLSQYDTNGNYTLDTDVTDKLPGGATVDPESNTFTDIYNTARSWISSIGQGLGYVVQLVGMPYFVLQAIFPSSQAQPIVFGIGAVWVILTLFLIVSWLFDRGT